MSEFKSFSKIPRLENLEISITQKMHGTNAQILIEKFDKELWYSSEYVEAVQMGGDWYYLQAGSRTRWLTPKNDNYGFAKFVYENKNDFVKILGSGRYYGEWCGPGINNGEGLKEKTLFLFDWRKYQGSLTCDNGNLRTVPVLNEKAFRLDCTLNYTAGFCMGELRRDGSRAVSGFMKPEGIVVQIGNQYFKKTFDNEEVAWKGIKKIRAQRAANIDVSHLLQPLRAEKLLSRDERYIREYPSTLTELAKAYVNDLIEENQFDPNDTAIKKELGRHVFPFLKLIVRNPQ